ncbi:Ras and EF-hand domain-containing protein [Sciurus carolinensis]|uniref:Ras and EF-hand domain-containing protein n=1 Tax=Sciurus carolinensis TaxID=30640 RepID=A0AA41NK30_SCICA|nr:Ras and EF-hand domain-containing protein [Sciurus carolinensis]
MEVDGDPEELARLRSLFAACDANRSGRLEREEFRALCAELRVLPADAEAVFQRLDADSDGVITFQEFARGFRGARRGGRRRVWGPLEPSPDAAEPGPEPADCGENMGNLDAASDLSAPWGPTNLGRAWQDFQERLGEEAKFIPRKEQVSTLYQNINLVEPRLIQPYEHVIKNFIREIKLQSTEMENLAVAVKRAQDKAAMQLSELEEEMDQRIQAAEHKTRKDEKRKAEEALSDLRRQYETEVGDLQVTIKKLKKLEEQSKHISQKEDVAALKKQIYDLSMENQKVKKELLEAQTNIAFLQSELDALKSDYADQSLNNERDLEIIREYTEDRNSLERQIEILQSSRSSYVDEDCDSLALCDPMQRMNYEVDSLPESCFDSGLSTLRDSNEYDSEVEYKNQRGFQNSQRVQESCAGDASDMDVPDIRDEETYGSEGVASVLDWKPQGSVSGSSTVGSSRKPISALSPQVGVDFQMKTLIVDGEQTVLQLWDTAGQERQFRSIAKSYFRKADGVLLLYDVTCEKSFLNVREWVDMIEDATHEAVPIMLVGNKADLRDSAASEGQKCVPGYFGEKLAMKLCFLPRRNTTVLSSVHPASANLSSETTSSGSSVQPYL